MRYKSNRIESLNIIRTGFLMSCFDWLETLICALVVSVIVITFFYRVVTVDGQSMENTLFDSERLVVRNFLYEPKNGDVVVIGPLWNVGGHIIIKRVIATEGQTLDINFDTGDVTVDGRVIDEPYVKGATKLKEGGQIPNVIPPGYLFVMGDHRDNSLDSRSESVGLIHKSLIVAKGEWVILPVRDFRRVT